MANPVTITVRPTGKIYGQGLGSACWDNDLSTYYTDGIGYASRLRTLSVDLSQIPADSVIKSVTYYISAYRTGNANYCGLAAALGRSVGTGETSQQRITPLTTIPLTDYHNKQTTSASQVVTAQESLDILISQQPTLWLEIYGGHQYYEIWAEVTYEPDESKLYVGATKASAVYVGTAKASAVYVGTTKVL